MWVKAEFEYERFYEDGDWDNNFRENFATNELSVTKQFRSNWAVKAGILPVPVGVTNSGGNALTIYDPTSESALLPMTWHETGVSVSTSTGPVSYELQALAYFDAPLKRSRMLGGVARVDYAVLEGLNVAASGYWGATTKGMIGFCHLDYLDHHRIFLGSVDFNVDLCGVIADGSYIYGSCHDVQSFGAECGYNVLHCAETNMTLTPFARYDGAYHTPEPFNCWKAGMNFEPLSWLILKAEYSWTHSMGSLSRSLDACVGVSLEF